MDRAVVSAKSQRLGDMVAGTLVVADQPEEMGGLRETLAQRSPADAKFRFDVGALKRAQSQDTEAVERILERWGDLGGDERQTLLNQVVGPLAARLGVDAPVEIDRVRFLEDFLAAEYRRQYRKLG